MGNSLASSSSKFLFRFSTRFLVVIGLLGTSSSAQAQATSYPDIVWESSYSIPGIVGTVSMDGDELCAKMEEHCEEENVSCGGHGRTRDLINEYLGAGDDFCRQFNRTYQYEDMFGCIWLLTEKYTPIKPDPATNPDGTLNCPRIRQWCETYAGSASMKGNKITVTPSRFICQHTIKSKYLGGCDPSVWDRVGGRTKADSTTTEEMLLLESDVSSVTQLP